MIGRATNAAIHVGKTKLGLDDDTYRAMLQQVAGVTSSKDLDEAGGARVLAEMRRRGFDGSSKSRRGLANQPLARKARAMWLALWNLDEVGSGSEKSLAAFAERITEKQDLRFCTTAELNRVVEALKSWSHRIGISASTGGASAARIAMVREQWARLHRNGWARVAGDNGISGFAHATAITANFRSVGDFEPGHLDQVAAKLGPHVRRLKLGRRHPAVSQTEGA